MDMEEEVMVGWGESEGEEEQEDIIVAVVAVVIVKAIVVIVTDQGNKNPYKFIFSN